MKMGKFQDLNLFGKSPDTLWWKHCTIGLRLIAHPQVAKMGSRAVRVEADMKHGKIHEFQHSRGSLAGSRTALRSRIFKIPKVSTPNQ